MGCSRQQLERHYDHSTSNSRRENIVKTKRTAKQPEPTPDSGIDAFLLEAMKRYQAGEIDDATIMGLMKLTKQDTSSTP